MNNFLILTRNTDTYFIKRLIEEVGEEVGFVGPHSSVQSAGRVLSRWSGVYRDDSDLTFLKRFKCPIINPLYALEIFRSKERQYEFFNQHSLPCLPWVSFERYQSEFASSFPELLVKPDRGQGGWGIEVHDRFSLEEWREQRKLAGDTQWVIQPFIKSPRELRIFFIGEEVFCLERLPVSGQVRANYRQDGEAKVVKLDTKLEVLVLDLIAKSKAVYGAIDLLLIEEEVYILELNTVPGIEQLEKVTGLNIMQKLVAKFLTFQ